MKLKKTLLFLGVGATAFTIACGSKAKAIDPTAFPVTDADRVKVEIPEACRVAYERAVPKVAVVDFANNTTFDLAKVVESQEVGAYEKKRVSGGAAGVVVGPGGAGVGWVSGSKEKGAWARQAQTVSRDVNAKLGESVAEAVVTEVAQIGGMKIYTRRDLQKVMQEQKFQMSGLVDPNTAVQIGKLAGVKYLITGAVNNVNIVWRNLRHAKAAAEALLGTAGTLLAAGAETQEGWNVTVDLTIKVIDAETGEIVLSKKVSGREVLGKTFQMNYDAIIGGIKKAASEAVEDIKPELSRIFALRGYIIQLRTAPDRSVRYALINVGTKMGVREGQEFYVIDFQDITDPITGKSSCDQIKLPVTLVVSKQIQLDKAWAVIEGDPKQIMRVKLGQVVERKPLKGQGLLKKMF